MPTLFPYTTLFRSGQTDVIKADVTFAGAPVPLPPSIALLASALLGLGMVSLRRRTLTRISFETDSRRLI